MTGIENPANNFSYKVYPNPVNNELIIEVEGNKEELSFELYNSIGKLVLKSTFEDKVILQTNNFPAGVYLLKLFDETFLELIKVVKK